MAHNPFVWTRPVADPSAMVEHHHFANDLAARLRPDRHLALFNKRKQSAVEAEPADGQPERIQQLAGRVWETAGGEPVAADLVQAAADQIMHKEELKVDDLLEIFENMRAEDKYALRLLAHRGEPARITGDLIRRDGLQDGNNVRRAFVSLEQRGLLNSVGRRRFINDPLLAAWIDSTYSFEGETIVSVAVHEIESGDD